MSVDWQWQEMTWHRTITPAAAGAGLERLATAVELGTVVLELRVGAEGGRTGWSAPGRTGGAARRSCCPGFCR